MDPNDSKALARPPYFALNLKRLPRELVHQVLDELPLVKVLQILSHKNQHLDDCVLTHIHYRLVFTSPADITAVIDNFILYREICRFTGQPLASATSMLAQKAISLPLNVIPQISSCMLTAIDDSFPTRGSVDLAILEAHASTPYSELANVSVRWEWIKKAKLNLNATKSRQLDVAANLMNEFPGKLMLKKPLDPSQDGPRKNLKHIENNLRMRAKEARRDGRLLHGTRGRCGAAKDNIELVPYERYLWLFLDMLEKIPIMKQASSVEGELREMSLTQESTDSRPAEHFRYPLDIAECMDTVQKGIMYIYTSPPLLVVPRIDWESGAKPKFYIEMEPHSPNLPKAFHRCNAAKIMPHDEREYEWLRAFLKVVTWMENEFGSEKAQGSDRKASQSS